MASESGRDIGKAVYSIFTSPHHPPQKDHLPTLIVTPAGKPQHLLYIYMHTNYNQENYLLTPSDAGDLCVAKLFPPAPESMSSGSSSGHGHGPSKAVKCEASRNLRWSIVNTGVAMPTYKLTLPNPDGGEDQPLVQISKTNKNSPFWLMTYYTYAGHLIPPNRIEFGRIEKSELSKGGDGGTRVVITGRTEDQKAVWKTLGDGNEDMVEWCVLCGALNVIDDEVREAARAAGRPIRPPPSASSSSSQNGRNSAARANARDLHPTGRSLKTALAGLNVGSAPQDRGSSPRPTIHKARSFDSRPSFEGRPSYESRPSQDSRPPASPREGGFRAPSPMRHGPPSARPPQNAPPRPYGDPRLAASAGDPRRPDRAMPPPRPSHAQQQYRPNGSEPSQRYRTNSADPTMRSRGSEGDPRLYGLGLEAARDLRMGPPYQRASYDVPPRDARMMPEPSTSYDPRGPPPDASSRPARPAPPPGLRDNNAAPSFAAQSSRAPTQQSGSSSRGPLPQDSTSPPPRRSTDRERSMSSGPRHERTSSLESARPVPRHERTSSIEGARVDMKSIKSAPAPDHRRQTGREPSSYQPGARRFEKPQSPDLTSSPTLAYAEMPPSRGGVQLKDEPASRSATVKTSASTSPKKDSSPKEETHSATMGAAEKIKAQRLARARKTSNEP